VLLLPAGARALDVFDTLWSNPGILNSGAVLPGDTQPLGISPAPDLAKPLSLIEAVDLALRNNAQLKESWDRIMVQADALGQARTAFFPTLSASGSRVGDGVSYPGYAKQYPATWINSYQAGATANWQVFNFGAGFFGDRSAGHLLEAALNDHDAALQQSLGTVIQDYFAAVTAQEVYLGDCRDADIARQTLASTKRREASGVSTRSDTLQATTEMLKRVLDSNRDQGAYDEAMAVLVYDMGAPTGSIIIFPETLDQDAPYSGEDLRAWIAEAEVSHPSILAAEERVEASEDAVAAATADSLPSVDLSANYYYDGRPGLQLTGVTSRELLLAATVNVPLFNGFADLYKIRGAKDQLDLDEATLEDTRNSVLRDVVKAYWDTDSSFRNLQGSQDLLEAAQDGMKVAKRRFDHNAADLIEVYTAETALADARQERIQCLAAWRSSRLRLVASVGRLGRSELKALR